MLAKLVGALIGKKVAGNNEGLKGALIGAGAGALAKRGLPTLIGAAAAGYAAKKAWDWWNSKDEPSYPSEASPAPPNG